MRIPVAVWMVACALWWATPARAFVAGSWTHQPLSTHKIFGNAKAAGFGRTEQIEHAVRALRQVDPQVSEEDAITAVRRIMRPA